MRAGALTRRIYIDQRATGKDSAGQPLEQWTQIVRTYAEIQFKAGQEMAAGGGVVSKVDAWFDIRFRTNVTAAMRVRYGAQIFAIDAVMDLDAEHRTLRMICSTGANRG